MQKLLVAVLLLVFGGFAQAQNRGAVSLSGQVVDPSGDALAGAQVDLLATGVTQQTTITDDSGRFRFAKVAAGEYQIDIHSEGFAPTSVTVRVANQMPPPLRIVLPVAGVHQETTVNGDASAVSTENSDNQNSNSLCGQALGNLTIFVQ